MNNIKEIYQHAGKCYDQQNLRDILDSAMVSTPEEIIDDSPSLTMTKTTVKKPSASKSLCLFTKIFDVNKRIAKRRVGSAKSKRRVMKFGNSLWNNKTKRKDHSKINDHIKRNLYAWITRHPQVGQSTIFIYCLKVMFDDQIKPQLFTKLLLQVSIIELNNSLVSDPSDGGLKYDRYEDDNIIISDSKLRSLLSGSIPR